MLARMLADRQAFMHACMGCCRYAYIHGIISNIQKPASMHYQKSEVKMGHADMQKRMHI